MENVDKASLLTAVGKLASAGERAGVNVEQMIRLLNAGVSVETLLQLIASRLNDDAEEPATESISSRWVV